jgi:hypothetical protein
LRGYSGKLDFTVEVGLEAAILLVLRQITRTDLGETYDA